MEELDLLSEVARLYYEKNLTQSEISRCIHTSRSTVSRLLQESRDRKVVEIIIHYPWDRSSSMEQELQQKFGLNNVRVLDSQGRRGSEALRGVALLAARYIDGIIKDGSILGLSWGRMVYQTVQVLRPERDLSIKAVQLFGTAIPNNKIDGSEVVRLFAGKYKGQYYSLHAPLFVENPLLKQALLQDPHIRETLELAQQADIVITGIGSLESTLAPSQTWLGYLSRKEIDQVRQLGAVGHICAHHYDSDGKILEINLNRGIIGAGLSVLHSAPHVIGIACGTEKSRAILGALRGKHINTLITDDITARTLLE
ncbi:MAG TPA: sugar-binding transcriptional regulator [Negativicutes bacterium]|nr:sugar-binding transcriptional regulator [Negativicutes bacterium]